MEQVFFTAAIVCFALAIVAVIVAVIVFVRGDVMNAIRFLRHKPTKSRGTSARAKSRLRSAGSPNSGQAAASLAAAAADSRTDDIDRPTSDIDAPTSAVGEPQIVVPDAEFATDVLDGDATENPTDILDADDSEQPTGILVEDDSEQPTGILAEDDSEQPTSVLAAPPVGASSSSPAEQSAAPDTDDSEQPTTILSSESEAAGVVQQDEPTFRFILRRNEVVVHTEEVIE